MVLVVMLVADAHVASATESQSSSVTSQPAGASAVQQEAASVAVLTSTALPAVTGALIDAPDSMKRTDQAVAAHKRKRWVAFVPLIVAGAVLLWAWLASPST